MAMNQLQDFTINEEKFKFEKEDALQSISEFCQKHPEYKSDMIIPPKLLSSTQKYILDKSPKIIINNTNIENPPVVNANDCAPVKRSASNATVIILCKLKGFISAKKQFQIDSKDRNINNEESNGNYNI